MWKLVFEEGDICITWVLGQKHGESEQAPNLQRAKFYASFWVSLISWPLQHVF